MSYCLLLKVAPFSISSIPICLGCGALDPKLVFEENEDAPSVKCETPSSTPLIALTGTPTTPRASPVKKPEIPEGL